MYKLPSQPFDTDLELFCKKAFQREGGQCPPNFVEFSHGIVKRRGGLPLAIVVIAGLFSTKAKVISKWSKVLDSLSSEFETNLHLRSIIRILSFNYHHIMIYLTTSKHVFYILECFQRITPLIVED